MIEVLFFVFACLAEIIGTVVGFGTGTIFTPIALFFFDFKTALILVAFLHIFGEIGRIAFFKYNLNKRLILLFGIPSVVLTLIGALLVNYTPQEILKLILGIFLLTYSMTLLFKPKIRLKSKARNAIIGGSLSGFLAGLIGIAGAVRGVFLTSFNLKKKTYIATAAAISLIVDLTRIPVYLTNGFLPIQLYYYIPLLGITAVIGSYIGKRIVNKIPQNIFRKFVLVAIAGVSLKFIYDGVQVFL